MSILFFAAFIEFKSLFAVLLFSVIPVVVQTNEGERFEGKLLGIEDATVSIAVGSEERKFAFDAVSSIEPVNEPSGGGPVWTVQLLNGSLIAAESVVSQGDNLQIQPRRQDSLELPMKQVRSIRFRRGSPETDPQWLGWIEQSQRADLLIIRREGDRLDPQKGLVTGLTDETVGFDLEGTAVNAPLDKLEGVIFSDSPMDSTANPILVVDQFGSQWRIAGIQADLDSGNLELNLGNGMTHQIPLDQLSAIRLSSGMIMLAGLTPAESTFSTIVESRINPDLLNAFFSASIEDSNHLKMYGGSRVEYRVEQGFTKLLGSVERHPESKSSGLVTIHIELDGEEKWKHVVEEGQASGFEVPIENARRLVIRVNDGGDGEVGDTLKVSRPRLIK
ncbi:MAG: NPCBM/NEW2 domain-containing protein [Rubripirellula sp.]